MKFEKILLRYVAVIRVVCLQQQEWLIVTQGLRGNLVAEVQTRHQHTGRQQLTQI